MKVKVLSWKEIKCKTTKGSNKMRVMEGDERSVFLHEMKNLCGKVIGVEVVAGGYFHETETSILSITDWMLDLSYEEVEYPRFFRCNHNGLVWKFTSKFVSECVVVGASEEWKLGAVDESIAINYLVKAHGWEELPYDKERDLFHTQAVLCRDVNSPYEFVGLYNAIEKTMFTNSRKKGLEFDRFTALPEDVLSSELKEMRLPLDTYYSNSEDC